MHTPELEQPTTRKHQSLVIGGLAGIATMKYVHDSVEATTLGPLQDDTPITHELNDYTERFNQYTPILNDTTAQDDITHAITRIQDDTALPDQLRSAAYNAQAHLDAPSPLETTIHEHSEYNQHQAIETIQAADQAYTDSLNAERQGDDAYEMTTSLGIGVITGLLAGALAHKYLG